MADGRASYASWIMETVAPIVAPMIRCLVFLASATAALATAQTPPPSPNAPAPSVPAAVTPAAPPAASPLFATTNVADNV